MITILNEEGSLGTPNSDHVIYGPSHISVTLVIIVILIIFNLDRCALLGLGPLVGIA